LGADEAKNMGVNVGRFRTLVIICATLITAASVSVSGVIGWVGLVIPHSTRHLVGNNYRYLMPASMLLGRGFLLAVDSVSRNLLSTEIPIGILTSFIGIPFFFTFNFRQEGRRLIQVEKLCFSYGNHEVLRNVSFSIQEGDFLSILGPNGVGKSTLFRCLLGLLTPNSETILLPALLCPSILQCN
jgi:ABC-type multidrug transport system fused ATPase/permease subunit